MAEYDSKLQPRDCHTSEEEDSRSSGGATTKKARSSSNITTATPTTDITTTGRKPRGRPPGSKNRPKPPIILTRDSENAMRPHILEIPSGHDIADAVATFARRRQLGLCVMSGSGTISNVTLRQPTTPGATVTFHGRFDILSLSATYLPSSEAGSPGFTISLAGAHGQVVGGAVVGSLIAAGTVVIVAASFQSPSFHRLPADDDDSGENRAAATPPVSTAGGSGESCGVSSIYSVSATPLGCHLPSDVLWTPGARPPY
ncbi:hypothetical protein AMTR_s00135p00017880 [Amborella trichopoda]|uniref:PPC domain-containing protein n=2 Tax=Amborella trichopoda TaxID=13333 RepID=W1NZ51_AMBTC|nr:hypothetical protein AMTR_s00135p00017880 [Amborella trichopoda]